MHLQPENLDSICSDRCAKPAQQSTTMVDDVARVLWPRRNADLDIRCVAGIFKSDKLASQLFFAVKELEQMLDMHAILFLIFFLMAVKYLYNRVHDSVIPYAVAGTRRPPLHRSLWLLLSPCLGVSRSCGIICSVFRLHPDTYYSVCLIYFFLST